MKTKRALSTPDSPKIKHKRQRVIDFLTSSIEKLNVKGTQNSCSGLQKTNPRRALFLDCEDTDGVSDNEPFATPILPACSEDHVSAPSGRNEVISDHVYSQKRCCGKFDGIV